jgi:hypothetical protein
MGFRKSWDECDIVQQIHAMARDCTSPYNTGFVAFEIKKDLYQIKEIIDQALQAAPTFSGEEEWLTEQEKKRIIKILKQ